MFVVYLGSILTTVLWMQALMRRRPRPLSGFILAITLWLWFTVLFANFAEALAEGRRQSPGGLPARHEHKTIAKVLQQPRYGSSWLPWRATNCGRTRSCWSRPAMSSRPGRRGDRRRRLGR